MHGDDSAGGPEGLRRYLRQLREMGESELVFNDMSAARALRLIRGAVTGTARDKTATAAAPIAAAANAPIVPEASRDSGGGSGDWRAALIAAGGDPGSISSQRKPRAAAARPVEPSAPAEPDSGAATTKATSIPRYELLPAREAGAPAQDAPRSTAVYQPGLDVQPAVSDIFAAAAAFPNLEAIAEAVAGCRRCPLHASATNPVPGEGNPSAELVCVGEGPGASEDETGRPFVGAAGKLLTQILGAINLDRKDVFICNVVKHRPPSNRTPLPDEIHACQPYLVRQLELIRPKVILALGTVAAQTLLGTKLTIGKLRGSVHRYDGIPLIVTYHPAALLRNPSWKRPTWEDVQYVRRILDGARGT